MLLGDDLLDGILTFISHFIVLELWSWPIIYVFFLKDLFTHLWLNQRQIDEDEEYYENFSFLYSNENDNMEYKPSATTSPMAKPARPRRRLSRRPKTRKSTSSSKRCLRAMTRPWASVGSSFRGARSSGSALRARS